MSKIIPNTFPTPNSHVDAAMHYLTGDQYKVLNFAVRHVYGWHNRPERYQGRISLSVFVDGFTTEEGQRYLGCGLGRNIIVQILDQLVKFGLLVKNGDPTQDGQRWGIGPSPDWDLIAHEYEKREAPNKLRAQKMNDARARKRAKNQVVSSHDTGTSDDTTPVSSHDTASGTSDDTHKKTYKKHPKNSVLLPSAAASGESTAESSVSHTHTQPLEAEQQASKQSASKQRIATQNATTPTPPIPAAPPSQMSQADEVMPIPSSRQIHWDRVEALVNAAANARHVKAGKSKCLIASPIVKSDHANFRKKIDTLIEAGIRPDMYPDYIAWIESTMIPGKEWDITLNSLVSATRPSLYMAEFRAGRRQISTQGGTQVVSTTTPPKNAYNPLLDDAYAPRDRKQA